jgi:uncharacterized membrane protein YfcA
MKWFNEHLNCSLVLSCICTTIIGNIILSKIPNPPSLLGFSFIYTLILYLLMAFSVNPLTGILLIIAWVISLITALWYLRKKGRSKNWFIIMLVFFTLWWSLLLLKNKSDGPDLTSEQANDF